MNLALPYEPATNRILALSALGSIALHGLILALLTLSPKAPAIDDAPARVQVQLVTGVQEQATPQALPTPMQPSVPSAIPPPMPFSRPMTPQPAPPVPTTLQRPQPVTPQPQALPAQKPVLQDSRAVKALEARKMMKMAPSSSRPSLQTPPQTQVRTPQASMVPPPMPRVHRQQTMAPALPPSLSKAPQALQAAPPSSAGGGTTKPVLLASSKPLYPRVAREAGWAGTVIVRTLIDTEGKPSQTEIRKSSGHPSLDQSAMEAIKTWKFRPAKDGNIPISKWVDIPVKFDLDK